MSPDTEPTASARRVVRVPRFSAVTWTAVVLIALQLLTRAYFVMGSYYFQDDYAHLDLARRLGLSSDYLVRDYGGHLEVGQYALIWLLSHAMDENYTVAALSVLVMQAVTSVLLWLVLRQLFGSAPTLLVPFAVYLFTPLALTWSTWWAAALQTLPLQTCMLLSIWGVVAFLRDGRRLGAVVSVLAHIAGLVLWQKAAFILPTLLAVHVLVVARGPLGQRLLSVARRPVLWLVHAVVLGVYVPIYLSVVDSVLAARDVAVLGFVDDFLVRMTIPGLFGGPWHANGAENTVYPLTSDTAAVVLLVALALVVWESFHVTGNRALAGWTLVVGYLSADMILLALGRSDFLGFLARDPRFVADALPIVAIGLAAAFRGVIDGDRSQTGSSPIGIGLRPVVLAVAALYVSGTVTQVELAPVVQHEYSRNYATTLVAQLAEEPPPTLVRTRPPVEISIRTDLEQLLNAVGVSHDFNRPGTSLSMVDGFGMVRPAAILGGTVSRPAEADCGWTLGASPVQVAEVKVSEGETTLLRVDHAASEEGELSVLFDGVEQVYDVEAGASSIHFVLPEGEGAVELSATTAAEVCVSEVETGPAWIR